MGEDLRTIHKKRYARLTNFQAYQNDPVSGWDERLEHLELIKAGAKTFCVLCTAVDPSVQPRTIQSFDGKSVFVGGGLLFEDGDYWLELRCRKHI